MLINKATTSKALIHHLKEAPIRELTMSHALLDLKMRELLIKV